MLAAAASAAANDSPQRDPSQGPLPSLLPTGLQAAVTDAVREVQAAATLGQVERARQRIERIAERQRHAGVCWLVADSLDRAAEESPDKGAAAPRIPLSSLIARLRSRLAAEESRLLREPPDQPAIVSDAAAARDLQRLRQIVEEAASGVTVVHALLTIGDMAAEGGWLTAAVEVWRRAEEVAQQSEQPSLLKDIQRRLRAPMVDRLCGSSMGSAGSELSSTEPSLPALRAEPIWQSTLPVGGSSSKGVSIRLTSRSDGTAPLVCWHSAGGIHARRLADGSVPWAAPAQAPVSDRLFPPASPIKPAMPAWAPWVHGGRLLSIVGQPTAAELICLDITDAAEGRLVWAVPLAAVPEEPPATLVCMQGFRGDGIVAVCLPGPMPELIALCLADGGLLWRQRLGLNRREPSGRQQQTAVAAGEDLVVVAAADGSTWAVNHAGDLIWVREASAVPDGPACPSLLVGCGCVVVRSADCRQLSAVDLRTGRSRWQVTTDGVFSLVGMAGGVLVALQDDCLVSFSLDDGSRLARRQQADAPLHGNPLLAEDLVFWPTTQPPSASPALNPSASPSASAEQHVLVLRPATLQLAGPPLRMGLPGKGSMSLAAGHGKLVVCDERSLRTFGINAAE